MNVIHLEKNITSKKQEKQEEEFEINIRPHNFDEFVGQSLLKKNLKILIEAAKKRKEMPEHIILYGPAGLGKTTLAGIIAKNLQGKLKITSGPAIEKSGDIAALLTNLEQGDVLFIDEIHRLRTNLEEMLFSAMEDFAIDLMMGKGAGAKSMRLSLPPFTLIGATTKIGSLSSPLRDRFGFLGKLNLYENEEIEKISLRSAKILDIAIDQKANQLLAKCSRKTPRITNRLIKRLRDFAHHKNSPKITLPIAQEALKNLGIDEIGLDENDRKFLKTIIEKFAGGPVGLSTISVALNEDKETIEELIEPFLIQEGFLKRTSQGRVTCAKAFNYLNLPLPVNQKSLF